MPVVRGLVYFSAIKLAFYSTQNYDKEYFACLNPGHEINFLENTLKEKTVTLITEETVGCAFVNDDLSAPVISALADKGIKLIAMRCAGYHHVDLSAAKQAGIAVVRVPAYSPFAVAEHAVPMIMTLNRKTHKAYSRVRKGNIALDRLTGFDLHGKTVTVIGMGKIGRVFSQIMSSFGCKVLVHDLYPDPYREQNGWQITEMDEVFRLSDIISLIAR